jgi:hypothetical protein
VFLCSKRYFQAGLPAVKCFLDKGRDIPEVVLEWWPETSGTVNAS